MGGLCHKGEILRHQQMRVAPEPFLQAIALYREEWVVGVG
jgi:hypothetical protein